VDAIAVRTARSAEEWAERLMASMDIGKEFDRNFIHAQLTQLSRAASDKVLEALEARRLRVVIDKSAKRAYAVRATKEGRGSGVSLRNSIAFPKMSATDPATFLHEVGHHIEYSVLDANGELPVGTVFRDFHARDPEVVKALGVGYRKDEVYMPDDWSHPYIGKVYGGQSSEVVSMGIQQLFQGNDYSFEKDSGKALLRYTLGILRGGMP
jgi:hypothetical protein